MHMAKRAHNFFDIIASTPLQRFVTEIGQYIEQYTHNGERDRAANSAGREDERNRAASATGEADQFYTVTLSHPQLLWYYLYLIDHIRRSAAAPAPTPASTSASVSDPLPNAPSAMGALSARAPMQKEAQKREQKPTPRLVFICKDDITAHAHAKQLALLNIDYLYLPEWEEDGGGGQRRRHLSRERVKAWYGFHYERRSALLCSRATLTTPIVNAAIIEARTLVLKSG